jgi:hypothetical protein
MDRHERTLTALKIALLQGLYLAIIMDHREGPVTVLTIALHKMPLLSPYNGPS